ncbi:cytochrome P450 [Mycena galericulata]|nr:cytochrome P450 [Mycena galericulata]
MPGPSMGNPILGRSKEIADPAINKAWAKEYGACFRVMGPLGIEAIMCMSPKALDQILVKEWDSYPRPKFFRNMMWVGVGRGLSTVTGDDHKRMRAALNPAFSNLNLSLSSLQFSTPKLIATPEMAEYYASMIRLILDILCETIFGQPLNSINNTKNGLAVAFEKFRNLEIGECPCYQADISPTFLSAQNFWRLITTTATHIGTRHALSRSVYRNRRWFTRSFCFGPLAGFSEAVTEIRDGLKSMIPDDVHENVSPGSLLDILTHESGSESDLINHLRLFITAGQGTVATALAWTLYFLANDPESQRILRDELNPVFKDEASPSYRLLKNLKWLNCVINESLRVSSPFPVVVREATKVGRIDGFLVPKGTVIVIPVSSFMRIYSHRPTGGLQIEAINTRQEVWGPDADDFRPSRWLDLPLGLNLKFSTLTFLAGPLHCMGRPVALMQLKMIVASLIYNFEFLPPFLGYSPDAALLVTKHPRDEMPLLVRRVS